MKDKRPNPPPQAPSERNYHIFYQLCAAAESADLEALALQPASAFHYTKQGGEPRIANVDDQQDFEKTKEALSLLGVSDVDQQKVRGD